MVFHSICDFAHFSSKIVYFQNQPKSLQMHITGTIDSCSIDVFNIRVRVGSFVKPITLSLSYPDDVCGISRTLQNV